MPNNDDLTRYPLGSNAFLVFDKNVRNLDVAVNDKENECWEDRFGKMRRTWHGMESNFDRFIDASSETFQQFLINSGYQDMGDYGPGLEITARNQIFWRDGELYRAGAALELPYTTTGDWETDGSLFVAVGDAALRQELSESGGSNMVGFRQPNEFAIYRSVQEKLQEWASVADFGAVGDGVTDDYDALQKAFDSFKFIWIPEGMYVISRPLYIRSGVRIIGAGGSSGATTILKTSVESGEGSNTARGGAVTDSYDKNAILIFRHEDNDYTSHVHIEGVQLKSNGYIVDYGIYAPRITHCMFNDVYIMQCRYGFVTHDAWMNNLTKVIVNANSVDPAGVPLINSAPYGWSGSVGFWWQNDGTNSATGTTLNAIGCWARDCHIGWSIYGLQYSTLNSCAADNITSAPYFLHLCKITLNSCATENAVMGNVRGAFTILEGYVTMNSCQSQKQMAKSDGGTVGGVFVDGARVVFNSCQFDDFHVPGNAFNLTIQDGARVISNGTRFPQNGNNFVSFSGGSQFVDSSTTPPSIRSSQAGGLSRYMKTGVRSQQSNEIVNKQVPVGGATILRLSRSVSTGFGMAAVRLRVTWSDTAFPSGLGMSDMQVAVYREENTFREGLNVSVNMGAGVGFENAPEYTITRSGSVWSITMIPKHGGLTANTISMEIEHNLGCDIELVS